MMKIILDWVLARAVEPSTWAGVAAALVSFAHLNGGDAGYFAALLASLSGALAMILREKGVA